MSDGSPKLIAIDEEPNHHVVHALCLGKADRPAYQPLDPGAQGDGLALNLLRVFLANRVLLCRHMPLVGTPAVGERARDAQGLSQRFERQKDGVLPSSEHIGQHLARVVINGVPEPARIGCAAHVAPPLVELGAAPMTHLECIRTPYLSLALLGMEVLQDALIHRLRVRCLFFNALITVVGLTCNTRAVSRMPLAFMAISTICCLTSGD